MYTKSEMRGESKHVTTYNQQNTKEATREKEGENKTIHTENNKITIVSHFQSIITLNLYELKVWGKNTDILNG